MKTGAQNIFDFPAITRHQRRQGMVWRNGKDGFTIQWISQADIFFQRIELLESLLNQRHKYFPRRQKFRTGGFR